LKNSVYLLPNSADAEEDFQWLAIEVQRDGGEALIWRSQIVSGITDAEIISRFNADRDEAFRSVRESAAAELRDFDAPAASAHADWRQAAQASYAAAQRRLADILRLDFFGAEGRSGAEAELRRFHELLQRPVPVERDEAAVKSADSPDLDAAEHPRGATWVTRAGVFVDRMASAWLVRRFIDPEASFKFIKVARYHAAPGEIRFDMMPAEFTHEGDLCTFEVLLDRFAIDEAGLRAIAEVVHDIDLKDEKFARSEAPGIEAVLTGIVNAVPDDDARLSAAFPLFDALYDRFRGSTG
jgi:hypothetical protein